MSNVKEEAEDTGVERKGRKPGHGWLHLKPQDEVTPPAAEEAEGSAFQMTNSKREPQTAAHRKQRVWENHQCGRGCRGLTWEYT